MIVSAAMALACAAVFGGAVVQGIVGFGMGLLSASITLRALGPQLMAAVNVGLAVFMNASLFFIIIDGSAARSASSDEGSFSICARGRYGVPK